MVQWIIIVLLLYCYYHIYILLLIDSSLASLIKIDRVLMTGCHRPMYITTPFPPFPSLNFPSLMTIELYFHFFSQPLAPPSLPRLPPQHAFLSICNSRSMHPIMRDPHIYSISYHDTTGTTHIINIHRHCAHSERLIVAPMCVWFGTYDPHHICSTRTHMFVCAMFVIYIFF